MYLKSNLNEKYYCLYKKKLHDNLKLHDNYI